MFLSVVILGGFTTETHAMALHIQRPTRRRHLHRFTGRNPGAATALTRRTASNRSGQIHGRLRALSCPPVGSSYWPLLGTFVSASGQFFMSADTGVNPDSPGPHPPAPPLGGHGLRYLTCVSVVRLCGPEVDPLAFFLLFELV